MSVVASAAVATGFGSFTALCSIAHIPACSLFTTAQTTQLALNTTTSTLYNLTYLPPSVTIPAASTNATNVTWYAPVMDCQMTQLTSVYMQDAGNLVMCIVGILFSFYLMRRVRRKQQAVGWKELNVFLLLYAAMLLVQAVWGSFVDPSFVGVNGTRFAGGFMISFVVAVAVQLAYLGFIGYQAIPDGSTKSLIVAGVLCLVFWAIALGVTLGTAAQASILNTWADGNLYSPAVMGINFILPGILILLYMGLSLSLVMAEMGLCWPMLLLVGASIVFAGGQIMQMQGSYPLCMATNGAIDGTFFQTFMTFLAVVGIYKFWDAVTEGDEDDLIEKQFPEKEENLSDEKI